MALYHYPCAYHATIDMVSDIYLNLLGTVSNINGDEC